MGVFHEVAAKMCHLGYQSFEVLTGAGETSRVLMDDGSPPFLPMWALDRLFEFPTTWQLSQVGNP